MFITRDGLLYTRDIDVDQPVFTNNGQIRVVVRMLAHGHNRGVKIELCFIHGRLAELDKVLSILHSVGNNSENNLLGNSFCKLVGEINDLLLVFQCQLCVSASPSRSTFVHFHFRLLLLHDDEICCDQCRHYQCPFSNAHTR